MPTIVQTNRKNDLREFAELLKFDLDIQTDTKTIMDTIKYLEHRGWFVYKATNYYGLEKK